MSRSTVQRATPTPLTAVTGDVGPKESVCVCIESPLGHRIATVSLQVRALWGGFVLEDAEVPVILA
jgi:hypothetical protein